MSVHLDQDQLIKSKQFIEAHDDFLVVSHIQPDGDAASSTCAVGWLLNQLNKQYIMLNEGKIPDKFKFLWGYSRINDLSITNITKKYKYIITVDCADFSRIGRVSELFAEDARILNIDHHPTNDRYGTINYIENDAAATVVLLYDLIESMNIPWSLDIANCIYTGLLTDTGGFRYANTSTKVMQIASALINHGVNANQMAEELLEKLTVSHIYLLKKALNSLSFSKNKQISWVHLSLEDMKSSNASSEDVEGIVNYPRNIEGVEVGICFKETDDNKVKVSFRSSGKVDVARLAQNFGGGGHVLASGATMEGSMEEVAAVIIKAIEKELT